uniref:Uncharacterized protein n=1 Tax=Oryza meridionalis TaxID=40149 RepID=A0A0E0D0W1_9ORYZ
MGMLSLKRLMARQRQREWRRRRQKAQKPRADGSIASERKGNNYQCGKRLRYSWPNFPEDIWSHIHSLMPLRDASRAACVSRAFLRSWRCHPNLIFSKRTLGLEQNACRKSDISRAFTCIVDHILTNHSGNGIKTLNLDIFDCPNLNTCDLNNWLQNAIKPGIEEITLVLPLKHRKVYSFPCSLLFGGSGRSLRYLDINGDELECLLANTIALKELELMKCSEIIFLKEYMNHCSVFDDASPMRLMTEHKKHKNLKNVTMIGFCSAKSMVELTCHILESTTSLECITLDTIASSYENEEDIIDRCCVRGTRRRECLSIGTEMILEAHRAILAIERYILGKVPAAVRLDVHRPCTRCHTV